MGLPQANADVVEDIIKRGELRVAVQTQGPPVSFIDKNGKRTGFAMEVIEMMAKDMGVKLKVLDYDWERFDSRRALGQSGLPGRRHDTQRQANPGA